MTERIEKLSIARSPEHVLDRHDDCRSTRERALENCVRIVSHQGDARAGAAECLRRLARAAFLWSKLVAHKKFVSVEHHLTVHQALAVRRHHVVSLFGAKHFFIELQRSHAIVDD